MELDNVMLDGVAVGKPVYALCTINPQTQQLKAKFYTLLIEGGPQPIWGVWTMQGKFKRFFIKKSSVADAYPKLRWRRMSGRLTLSQALVDQPIEAEKTQLVNYYKALQEDNKDNIVQFEKAEG